MKYVCNLCNVEEESFPDEKDGCRICGYPFMKKKYVPSENSHQLGHAVNYHLQYLTSAEHISICPGEYIYPESMYSDISGEICTTYKAPYSYQERSPSLYDGTTYRGKRFNWVVSVYLRKDISIVNSEALHLDDFCLVAKIHLKKVRPDEVLNKASYLTKTKRDFTSWHKNSCIELISFPDAKSSELSFLNSSGKGDIFSYDDRFWVISESYSYSDRFREVTAEIIK
ncbi:hypothetical protein [Anabaena azotica]|uniref:Uncharacterized protein n=1 Tax=Anabaena azotica FACHB-119 TaxID=947527 RepID=A0ABR8DCT0_9NOST|nr:hypothetical protein [Anabaena azotica]MBD2503946.1 hypothetical protein [Anabaena azotica FACHB-119]